MGRYSNSGFGHGTGGSPQGTLGQNYYDHVINNLTNKFPPNDSQIKHIFRPKEGHLSDTPENRKLIETVANIKIRGVISETKISAHCNVQDIGFYL